MRIESAIKPIGARWWLMQETNGFWLLFLREIAIQSIRTKIRRLSGISFWLVTWGKGAGF